MGEPKDRITVVETIYHQPFGQNPFSVEERYDRELETKEQPYSRHCKATEEWQPLDCGWLASGASLLHIKNDEKLGTEVLPTEEEKAEHAKHILRIRLGSDLVWDCTVPPGETMRICPEDLAGIRIQSAHGNTDFTLTLFPR